MPEAAAHDDSPILFELVDVSVVRGGRTILHPLSLRVREGSGVAILGPNGCGKSTLLKLLAREIHPFGGHGHVAVGGQVRPELTTVRRNLGFVGHEPPGPPLGNPTVREMVLSGRFGTFGVLAFQDVRNVDEAAATQAMDDLGILHLAQRDLAGLSTGERRRTMIARALVNRPRGLVLDEPTSGLDLRAAHDLLDALDRLSHTGVTLVMVTHRLEEVIPCFRRVLLMKNGRLVFDGDRNEALDGARLAALFEVPSNWLPRIPDRWSETASNGEGY